MFEMENHEPGSRSYLVEDVRCVILRYVTLRYVTFPLNDNVCCLLFPSE